MVQVQGMKQANVARTKEKHFVLQTLYLSVIPKYPLATVRKVALTSSFVCCYSLLTTALLSLHNSLICLRSLRFLICPGKVESQTESSRLGDLHF